MPYLTSGLVAFRKPSVEVVIQLAEWIRENCAPSVIYAVQLDGGRVNLETRESAEVGHFVRPKNLGGFAKNFKRPFWGGFAEGGYSNSQEAIAVDARGKLRWRSAWSFEYPLWLRRQSLYPLGTHDDNERRRAAEPRPCAATSDASDPT